MHKLVAKMPRKLKANELEENFSYDTSKSKYNSILDSNSGKNELYENA